MRKVHLMFLFIGITVFLLACNSGDKEKTADTKTAAFDLQKARAFVDSINTKWMEEIKKGDSVAIASHYASDGELLLSNQEPIKGNNILSTWGSIIRAGMSDWKFVTTNLEGNADYLVESGSYEINDSAKRSIDKGNYVIVWKQQNGEWKVYRDIGVSSIPAQPLH